ncbi:MAG TPA: hypothetical protein VME18_08320 [Acidobacteriaceae bacterium]|nr:hypothetical protein [Acidobacteriaceae bacterium]
MPLSSCLRRFLLPSGLLAALLAAPCLAQQNVPVPSPAPGTVPAPAAQLPPSAQAGKGPALLDPAGPAVSLQTSEAMFDLAVALNACGYDDGLNESNPVRQAVREEVNEATQASAAARDDRDQLCLYIDQHKLEDPAQNVAQYVSLALYLSPPPQLTPSVDEQDLPPDANGVLLMLPLVRKFASDIDLHVIWLENRPAYDAILDALHGPLSQMIVNTNYYLKMPASIATGRRFLVVIEPMLSPEETNARVYGTNYVVVASPKNGQIPMRLVRHVYLHYQIEPLLYSRQNDMIRMQPILRTVDYAPLPFNFKNDIVALVVESMIRAIEARIMNTGVQIVKVPAGLPRSQAEPYEIAHNESLQKDADVREQAVDHSMQQGFVITRYFYNQMLAFEKTPQSLSEAIGPMVYGMDVDAIIHQARETTFDQQWEGEMMGREPQQLVGLDLAEMKLMKGDVAGASALAEMAIQDHTGDPGRAEFILARADLMNNQVDQAVAAFQKTLAESKDARYLAWSHIYLGRIDDVEDERPQALAQYRAAMDARDGQPDTLAAAQSGLKKPFALPPQAQSQSVTPGKTPAAAQPSAAPQPQ